MNRSHAVKAVVAGALVVGALAAAPSMAEAQAGRLNFTGSANLFNDPSDPTGNTLFIDFLLGGVQNPGTPGSVDAKETISGAFDPEITTGDVGTISDLQVTAGGVTGLPVSPFVTLEGYQFTLTGAPMATAGDINFGPISLTYVENFGTIGFFGVRGTVTGGDFGMTERMFTGLFTAQFTELNGMAAPTPTDVFNQVNSGGTLPVSFSAEFNVANAQVVPEPSTYLLVATGMLAIGAIGRRRARRQQA